MRMLLLQGKHQCAIKHLWGEAGVATPFFQPLPEKYASLHFPARKGKGSMKTPFEIVFSHAITHLPNLAGRNSSAIHGWLDAGCDPEKDIIPTISRLALKNPSIGGFSYFTRAVLKARDERLICVKHEERIKADPEGSEHRKAVMAARTLRVFGIKNAEARLYLEAYEAKHGRIEA